MKNQTLASIITLLVILAMLPLPALSQPMEKVYKEQGIKVLVRSLTVPSVQQGPGIPVLPTGVNCMDSDNGQDYYTAGDVQSRQYGEFQDRCIPDTNVLREGYCVRDGTYRTTLYTCSLGCEDGACRSAGNGNGIAPAILSAPTCSNGFPADFNNDNQISSTDSEIFNSYFATKNAKADLDGDGIVTLSDSTCMNLYINHVLTFPSSTCEIACAQPIQCGNGVKDEIEQCDDGNQNDGDGCSNTCELETSVSCDQLSEQGWYARYYNYFSTHPDMELPNVQWPDATHGDPLSSVQNWTADWYDAQYFKFARVDTSLMFGNEFYPFNMTPEETTNGHEYHFGARWSGIVDIEAPGNYSFVLGSDDDSWVYVNGQLVLNNAGVHMDTMKNGIVYLEDGDVIDVFFAERHTIQSTMNFDFNEVLVHPYNEDCPQTCNSPLDFVDDLGNLGPDEKLGLSDATVFTEYYFANDYKADVNNDSKVDLYDYACAKPYYANGGPYSCELVCGQPSCVMPIDYVDDSGASGPDGKLGLSDAVVFTEYYFAKDIKADVNGDELVDTYDYECVKPYYGNGEPYECPIRCANSCTDASFPTADYNNDSYITIEDATLFTQLYLANELSADVDMNGVVDNLDYVCMNRFVQGVFGHLEPQPVNDTAPAVLPGLILVEKVQPVPVCEPRSQGYWSQPCPNKNGNTNTQNENESSIMSYLDSVHVQTNTFDGITTFEQYCVQINIEQSGSTQEERALREILALWMNLASSKCYMQTEVDLVPLSNYTTIQGALNESMSILDSEPERAKDIAEAINTNAETHVITRCLPEVQCGDSPLDYVNVNGTFVKDQQHSLSDAVVFTQYYLANTTMTGWNSSTLNGIRDIRAEVTGDGVVDSNDYLCAKKYYSTGLYECPIHCEEFVTRTDVGTSEAPKAPEGNKGSKPPRGKPVQDKITSTLE
ncbi:MAG: PA14 domain-containing protein [Candidatus Woesearchaeota archaeon]